ncbi:MAG TPA: FAD-binding oxidoreductase [Gaiellaceae bacterium]|nr:FAD-binding oxidoreductase [Gaiellaceae bacterium]
MTPTSTDVLRTLVDRIAGDVVVADDAGYDEARQAWNLAVDQRPVAVVFPESADDIAGVVRFAGENDLRIAFNAGGHNAGTIDWTSNALLLKTARMTGIAIDAAARRARVEAGVLAQPLADAAAEHGLAYLAGTSPDTGVLGYALGGGFSWMIRKYGLAANSIVAADVVTADGQLRRVDADREPDLFWALRGGGGSFGAVTALELALYPVQELYAGCFFWPIERAAEILRAWRGWIETVPEECHSIGRLLQLPEAPFLPPHLSGRSFVLVEVAFVGDEADGAALVRPLRDLGPELDTAGMLPANRLSEVNMDPDFPLPYHGDGTLLRDVTPATIDELVASFVGSPLLHAEMRHLGGAAAAGSAAHGVLDAIEQPFIFFVFGLAVEPELSRAVERQIDVVFEALAPWNSGRRYLNFAERPCDPRTIFPDATYERLCEVKHRYDPGGMFLANHPVTA